MQFRFKHAAGAALMAAVVGLAACSENGSATLPSEEVFPASQVASQETPLRELTRAVAVALQDPGLRGRVKTDMRNAPYFEHKLHFRGYLQSQSGGILLSRIAEVANRSRPQVLALLDQLPPMEFYMPVSAQRESWQGGDNLLVAGAPDGDEGPVFGYNLQGEPVALSVDEAPTIPTLVITAAETDFTKPINLNKYINVNDQGGRALGNYQPRGSFPTAQGFSAHITTSGTVQRRGISVEEFISHLHASKDHEYWFAGNAEFRLLVAGRQADGMEYRADKRIPGNVWDKSGTWKHLGTPISLATWDQDLGNRVQVQCIEEDFGTIAKFTVTGTTTFSAGNTAGIKVEFTISDDDDNCSTTYIDIKNTLGQYYYIPNGVDDDLTNPAPPYYNGTTTLKWYGYGLQRL